MIVSTKRKREEQRGRERERSREGERGTEREMENEDRTEMEQEQWAGLTQLRGRGIKGVRVERVLSFVRSRGGEWSPIEKRRRFPLPQILLKLPPEPLPFYPCHPTHPLNTLPGTVPTFSQ
ncbi:F-box and leucine-rich repeat protein 13 [Sarotherodon galilaeus]